MAIESGAHPYGEDFADTNPDHYFDAINFHKYLSELTLDEYFEQCDAFYRTGDRHNDGGKPALITECGFTDYDNVGREELNGQNMAKLIELYDKKMPYILANGCCMPSYEFMDIPGMDHLCRGMPSVQTEMQLSSVANQLGKKQILSETFAACGWNVSFEDLKKLYEHQMVHGINLLCQHLEGYSLRGIRKRDYPA